MSDNPLAISLHGNNYMELSLFKQVDKYYSHQPLSSKIIPSSLIHEWNLQDPCGI